MRGARSCRVWQLACWMRGTAAQASRHCLRVTRYLCDLQKGAQSTYSGAAVDGAVGEDDNAMCDQSPRFLQK